jgi:A/G-specific adenine glycosylase
VATPVKLPREALQRALLSWYQREKRDLPWRHTRDPYAIWLSEIMLQQTRVETVIPYYDRFLRALPTVHALAEASEDHVLSLWSGLGYYRRARMLHQAARDIAQAGGTLPGTRDGLLGVRGIGRYTAGAIASIAYGERAPLVDGNVARVLARLFAIDLDVRSGPGLAKIWSLAEGLVPSEEAGDWNQALMEVGATVCLPRAPRCPECPARDLCIARSRGIENTLPNLAAKTPATASRQLMLVAVVRNRKGDRVLLGRRRPGGLFGGLWEPPAVADGRDARRALATLLGIELPRLTDRGVVTHILSHRRLAVRVVSCKLDRSPPCQLGDGPYEAVSPVSPGSFTDLGMSTLARKVLIKAGVLSTS